MHYKQAQDAPKKGSLIYLILVGSALLIGQQFNLRWCHSSFFNQYIKGSFSNSFQKLLES